MINYVVGDLFRSPAKVLVNTVNTKGVMGKGLAKDFKAIYPEMFEKYREYCERGVLDIGKPYLFRTGYKWVLNFPTKKDWRHPSKPEYIEAGLQTFIEGYARNHITSIAFPQLGCGHGELDWESQVQPLMERYLAKLPISIFIYLYRKETLPKEHTLIEETRRWLHGEPESLGFDEVWDDLLGLFKDEPVAMLDVERGQRVERLDSVFDDGEGLHFMGADSFAISKEMLMEVWQQFRAQGMLLPQTLPETLEKHAASLLGLFATLPYVRRVDVARGRTPDKSSFAPAIQMVPRTAAESLELTPSHLTRALHAHSPKA